MNARENIEGNEKEYAYGSGVVADMLGNLGRGPGESGIGILLSARGW